MRQVFLDTETTGMGGENRIVEIGALEMLNRKLTGNHFHCYLNPERESEPMALAVHGLSTQFLQNKPKFLDISNEFLEFIAGAELIAHNAVFDVRFINYELRLARLHPLEEYCSSITCTLKIARKLHPGKSNKLDSVCERYQVDNSERVKHGAIIDAKLCAEVYLAMTHKHETSEYK